MAKTIAKDVTISGTNTNGNTVELEVPNVSQKGTWSNNINSFSKPNEEPPERRALNLNRWEFPMQITAKVTDRFVDKNHNGSGDRPDISNKEQWLDELYKLAIAQNIIDYQAVNDQTERSNGDVMPHAQTSGYIHNVDFTEKSNGDNSVYDTTIKLVDEVPMNS